MDNKTIEQLLSSLAALVGESRGSLFGQDKCMVDREQLLYLVEALQTQLPAEIEEAQTVIDNCNMLRNNAKKEAADTRREADRILQDAQARAARMIEESAITEGAKKREQEILGNARQQSEQLVEGALRYADRIMEDAQRTVEETFKALSAGIDALLQQADVDRADSMQRIAEARDALKNAVSDS